MVCRNRALPACALAALIVVAACGGEVDEAPADVLSRFLDAMERSALSESALADAYALLDSGARRKLEARAQHAELVSGRDFEPWEMLAHGRFRLRFAPAEHGGMRTKIEGNQAVVHVTSDDKRSRADVPLVREDGQWRVQLAIPEAHGASPETTTKAL
jgi:hypothetical protein